MKRKKTVIGAVFLVGIMLLLVAGYYDSVFSLTGIHTKFLHMAPLPKQISAPVASNAKQPVVAGTRKPPGSNSVPVANSPSTQVKPAKISTGTSKPNPPGELPALTFEQSVSPDGYSPGKPVDVSVSIDYPKSAAPVTAMAIVAEPPAGWEFAYADSIPPPLNQPASGTSGKLEFVWANIPSFPFKFSYTLQVPESEGGGLRQISGISQYRTNGSQLSTGKAVTPVKPKQN